MTTRTVSKAKSMTTHTVSNAKSMTTYTISKAKSMATHTFLQLFVSVESLEKVSVFFADESIVSGIYFGVVVNGNCMVYSMHGSKQGGTKLGKDTYVECTKKKKKKKKKY